MRISWLAFAVVLALAPASRAGEPSGLSVLHAGNLGSDRERDFKMFLAGHFASIGTTDYERFAEGQARDMTSSSSTGRPSVRGTSKGRSRPAPG